MKIGVVLPVATGQSADPAWVRRFARAAESLGYAEISVVEHSVVIKDTESLYPYSTTGVMPLDEHCDIPDPLELLSYIAGLTGTIGLATGVLILPNHHPVVLAKRLATLDRLSAGRLRACVGVGWMREEIEACGGDFAMRGRLADESIAAMRALWTSSTMPIRSSGVSFEGEVWRFRRAISAPPPVRPGGVPIYIGGHSLAAARRAGRTGQGFQPLGVAGDELRTLLAALKEAACSVDRDPDTIELVLGAELSRTVPSTVHAAIEAGAGRLLLSLPSGHIALEQILDEMALCAERLQLGLHDPWGSRN